jgi:outer membrane receptor protein involved in Fe transport
MNPARGADSEPADLAIGTGLTGVYSGLDRGSLMPEDNIPLYIGSGSNYGAGYWWYATMLQPWIQNNYMAGFTITHALSEKTFYEFTGSYQVTKENINPDLSSPRNKTVLGYLGPIPLTEAPYGRDILALQQTVDTVAGWMFDQYYSVPGLGDRFDSKGGVYYDNSVTSQLRLKFDIGGQVTKHHYIKTGVELLSINMDNKRWSYWPTQGPLSMYEYNFDVKPKTVGAYIQDEITFMNMVANVGIRMDYYTFGDLVWPTGSSWSAAAFAAPNWTPTDYLSILQSGRSIIWEHWRYVNDSLIAAGMPALLQPVKSHLVFSPRFGISFPITDQSKFYFNFGHFRSLPPLSEMVMYDFRYDNSKGGIGELGNPNLEPSKTIQYELGVEYNLHDTYLIHISGYYKDVSGEVRTLTYSPNTPGIGAYRFRTNDSYRTTQGLEFQITRNISSWLTGWVNLQYMYTTSGNTGRNYVYQDSASNSAASAFVYANPSRPDPVPTIKANINFRSPDKWGYWLGGWNLSVLPTWKKGSLFRFNPRNLEGADRELYWPNTFLMNMKLSKSIFIAGVKATAFLNINNVFNTKVFLYNYAFAGGNGSATGVDYTAYLASLHLSDYKAPYYDAIRNENTGSYLYPGYAYTQDITDQWGNFHRQGEVVRGDAIGDMHSPAKPHINDPNVDVFTYGNARSVWFGVQFDF